MLSQVSQSSKRLGKLKKYKSKIKGSGFEFLLQSLDRDKQNHVPNMHSINMVQLTHSVRVDPLMTAPVNSTTLQNNQLNFGNKTGKFFMKNVKLLDKSDASISDINQSNPSKKSQKKRENKSIKQSDKSKAHSKINKFQFSNQSKAIVKAQFSQLIYKTKQYLTLTDEYLTEFDSSDKKNKKKAKKISQQLINLITNIQNNEQIERRNMGKSVRTTSFNMTTSQFPAKGQQKGEQIMKKITSLQSDNSKLNSLISQHEMANIKMFIQMNQGQSEQIQNCKKQLSLLFDKYKKLQTFILSDKKKIAEIQKQKQILTKKCSELTSQNNEMMELIQKYQQALSKQKQQKKSFLIHHSQNSDNKSFKINIPPVNHYREASSYSIFDISSLQRGDLHIQSLNNSQNQSKISEQIGLGSSITTTTSRVRQKGGRLGINLNALFDNITQTSINKLVEDPQKLKRIITECKHTILKLQSVVSQQNKQLQISIMALQSNKSDLNSKDSLIKSLQNKIAMNNKDLDRVKQKQRNKNSSVRQNMKQNRSNNQSKTRQPVTFKKEKGKIFMDADCSKIKIDQYRIIALQAEALEQMLKNQKKP